MFKGKTTDGIKQVLYYLGTCSPGLWTFHVGHFFIPLSYPSHTQTFEASVELSLVWRIWREFVQPCKVSEENSYATSQGKCYPNLSRNVLKMLGKIWKRSWQMIDIKLILWVFKGIAFYRGSTWFPHKEIQDLAEVVPGHELYMLMILW